MMADGRLKASFALIFAFILLFLVVPFSSSVCLDGTYRHKGRNCCLCGIGLRVKEHCTTDLQYGRCEYCNNESYSSQPNGQMRCELCTSCSQINANQVEITPCSRARDRVCRCKDDHFCPSPTGSCAVCNPCTKCGAEGVKVACKGNNDTVCNERNEGNSHVGPTIGIVVGVIVVVAAIGTGVFFYKKRQCGSGVIPHPIGNEDDALFIPDEVDLEPHFPDLVKVIGWRDMQDIALRSSISGTTIECCKLNHPGDANEQTLELLQIWNEKQGRKAGNKLKQILQDIDKKKKAQEVTNILLRSVRNNSPV